MKRVTTILTLLLTTPILFAQEELIGSGMPWAPTDLEGTQVIRLDDQAPALGEMVVTPPADGSSALHDIASSPVGPGQIFDDPTDPLRFTLQFASGPVPLQFDTAEGRHEFTLGGAQGHLQEKPCVTYHPFGEGPGMPRIDISKCNIGIFQAGWRFRYDNGISPCNLSMNWVQFIKPVFLLNYTDADGDLHFLEPPPDDFTIQMTGNGGRHKTPQQAAAGAGTVKPNGKKTYVDSGDASDSNYVTPTDGGSAGPNFVEMIDTPRPTFGGVTQDLLAHPDIAELNSVTVRYEFTTYLFLCGQPVYKLSWTFEFSYMVVNGQAQLGMGIPMFGGVSGSPVTGLDANHQTSLNNFNGGNYSGG